MGVIFALGIGLIGALIQVADAPWWITVGTGVPCLVLLPGWAIARRIWPRSSLVQSMVDATWAGLLVVTVGVALMRLSGLGSGVLWAVSAGVLGVVSWRSPNLRNPQSPSGRVVFGLAVLGLSVATLGASHSPTLSRGLDVGWYHADLQESLGDQVLLSPGEGWQSSTWISSQEEGALSLIDDSTPGGSVMLEKSGPVGILVRGPLGTQITASQGDQIAQSLPVSADVVEAPEEGPVPRYLDRGMTGVLVEATEGPMDLTVSGTDGSHEIFVLPGQEAIWALDRSGQAKFLHYYQLLNKVENQRWALETLETRHLTINQPPLWSYVLAVPAALHDGEMGGANLLFLMVILLVGLSALSLVETLAPEAPWGAFALPGLYTGIHFHMMVVPGSTNFPDSLYTAALLGGLAALAQLRQSAGTSRFALLGTAAGLLRYPGTAVLTLAALLQWMTLGRRPWRALKSLWLTIAVVAAAIGIAGLVCGLFGEWLSILWFETGPEHWDNNQEAPPLFHRPLEFYSEWARYQGFGRLGAWALPAWSALTLLLLASGKRVRWILGTALSYSLILCTIDHFPSHYFLPLVAMMGLAMATACDQIRSNWMREGAGLLLAFLPLSLLLSGGPV